MQPGPQFYLLLLTLALGYLFSLSSYSYLAPQAIALLSLGLLIVVRLRLNPLPFISLLVSLIIFISGGLSSPFYFLVYFLLFSLSFQINPISSLLFSLALILLLGQTLSDPHSLFSLISLLFITPLVWFASRQKEITRRTQELISRDETDFLLWHNLKFKTGITTIIDLSSLLHSSPLNYTQKEQVKKIRDSARSLLNSSQKLTSEISDEPDQS